MGWLGGDPPPAPDYRAAAQETAQSSKENLAAQTWANRPTQVNPWGTESWTTSPDVDPGTGTQITRWTQNTQLNPQLQSALNDQINIQAGRSAGANTLLGQSVSAFQTPFDWANLPGRGNVPQAMLTDPNSQALDQSRIGSTTETTNEPAFAGERQRIENALFERMRPEHERQTAGAQTRLANMGMSMGSAAYNRELERLGGLQAGERFNALQTGGAEQQRLQQMLMGQQQQAFGQDVASQQAFNAARQGQFNMQLGANTQNFNQSLAAEQASNQLRQQAIAEEAQRRNMPLNELNALLTGQQVTSPTFPTFSPAGVAAPTNYLGAAQLQGQANQQDSGGSGIGTLLGGLAGSFLGPAGTAAGSAAGTALFGGK